MKIALGFCPAADGGVIAYALAAGRVPTGALEVQPVAAPLPSLNDRASRGELEVSMVSAAAYPCLAQRYVLADCGACFATGGGPVLAAREPLEEAALNGATVATGDATSSAYVALHLYRPGVRTRLLPADKLAAAVKMGLADCALLPEGNGSDCRRAGLYPVADLAAWWRQKHEDLPLPLTCLVIRRDVPQPQRSRLGRLLKESIRYGMAHRAEAMAFAGNCARAAGIAPGGNGHGNGSCGTYVGELTVEMGSGGKRALELFLRRGHEARVVPPLASLEFDGPGA